MVDQVADGIMLRWDTPTGSYQRQVLAQHFKPAPWLHRPGKCAWGGETFGVLDFDGDPDDGLPRAPDAFTWARWFDMNLDGKLDMVATWQEGDDVVKLREVAIDILLTNGRITPGPKNRCRGPMQGVFSAYLNGHLLVKPMPLTINDGRSVLIQLGPEAPYSAPAEWEARILRYAPAPEHEDTASLLAVCRELDPMFDFSKYVEPDESGSPASCAFEWEGAIAAALLSRAGEPVPGRLRKALRKWLTDYALRPFVWHDRQGNLLRAAENGDVHVDEQGWVKTAHGDWARPSTGHQWPDIEHRVGRRKAAAWWMYGEPAARFFLDAESECLLTKPECKMVKPMTNTRARGYLAEEFAEAVHIFGAERPQFRAQLLQQLTCMQIAGGTVGGRPYPARNDPKWGHPDHLFVSARDCWAFAVWHGWGEEVDPAWLNDPDGERFRPLFTQKGEEYDMVDSHFTTGDQGPWGLLRYWCPWMLSIAGRGACRGATAINVPEEFPKLPAMVQHWLACMVGPARGPAIDAMHEPIKVVTVLDSLSALVPGRGFKVHSDFNSTTPWILTLLTMGVETAPVPKGLEGQPVSQKAANEAAALALAKLVYQGSTELQWPQDAAYVLRTAFPCIRLFGLNRPAVKA